MVLKSGRRPFDGIKPIYRVALLLIGGIFLGIGTVNMFGGRLNYVNAWGDVIFTPFAILIGASLVVAIVVAWVRDK